jgi:hypothetical protein
VIRNAVALIAALLLIACGLGTPHQPMGEPESKVSVLLPLEGPGKKYGYIDGSGTFVIPPQFAEAASFQDGLAVTLPHFLDGSALEIRCF